MTLTCTILKLSPVSAASVSLVFRQGLGDISKHALKARLCCVVRMVLGRFGPRRLFFVHNSSQRYSSELGEDRQRDRQTITDLLRDVVNNDNNCTVVKTLQHLHLLLVVGSAEQLTSLDHELVALLQLTPADDTDKTPQVEDVVGCPVHEFIRMDFIAARETFVFREYPE